MVCESFCGRERALKVGQMMMMAAVMVDED